MRRRSRRTIPCVTIRCFAQGSPRNASRPRWCGRQFVVGTRRGFARRSVTMAFGATCSTSCARRLLRHHRQPRHLGDREPDPARRQVAAAAVSFFLNRDVLFNSLDLVPDDVAASTIAVPGRLYRRMPCALRRASERRCLAAGWGFALCIPRARAGFRGHRPDRGDASGRADHRAFHRLSRHDRLFQSGVFRAPCDAAPLCPRSCVWRERR